MILLNSKCTYFYYFYKSPFFEYSTESNNNIEDIRKKLRILHKLDLINTINKEEHETSLYNANNMDSLMNEDNLIKDQSDNTFKDNPDPKHTKFLKSLSVKDEEKENVILTNYGVIRPDNINQLKKLSNKYKQSKESTNNIEANMENLSNDIDVQYFSKLIKKAPELIKNDSNDFKASLLDEECSDSDANSELNSHHPVNLDKYIDHLTDNSAEHYPVINDETMNLFDNHYFREMFPQNDDFLNNINISLKENLLGKDFVNNDLYSMNNDTIDITTDQTPSVKPDNYFEKSKDNRGNETDDTVNIFDAEYFPNMDENLNQIDISNNAQLIEFNKFLDENYIKHDNDLIIENELKIKNEKSTDSNNEIIKKIRISPDTNSRDNVLNINRITDKKNKYHFYNEKFDTTVYNSSNTIIHEGITQREIKNKEKCFINLEEPKTAYDLVMKMRKENLSSKQEKTTNAANIGEWKGRLDSKGFKILKDQTLDLTTLPKEDVVSILKDNILYEDDQIVVIDKPYGLPSHGGPGIVHSIGQLLADLTLRIDKKAELPFHLIHRLDKDTTGIIILARSAKSADILRSMLNEKQIIKKYWAITKGVPAPTEGIIDIPMGEGSVVNKYRMELRPNYPSEMRLLRNINKDNSAKRIPSITKYRVISHHQDAALVECQLETGTKHQIRCHLAFGLNTPILGDHKYSHYNKFAPQKLPGSMLQHLGIRQETVRYIPMHLHAHSVILQQFKQGKNLFITAKPPKFFMQNLKWLKLVTK